MPRDRIAALVIVVIGVIVLGFAVGFDSEASAEPTVQGFLLDWQQQQYAAAGALTTGAPGTVAAELRGAFSDLDATALFLSMDSVVQHGGSAVATYTASVDLATDNRVWTYQGTLDLTKSSGNWVVDWSPQDIAPGLGQGDRLAVLTTFPSRGLILDSAGQPLESPSLVYVVGVVPDRLANPAATATSSSRRARRCWPRRTLTMPKPPRPMMTSRRRCSRSARYRNKYRWWPMRRWRRFWCERWAMPMWYATRFRRRSMGARK